MANELYSPLCISQAFSTQHEFWIPKTTLAQFNSSVAELSDVIRTLEPLDFTLEMIVTEMTVLEYGEEGEEGEKHILSFNL